MSRGGVLEQLEWRIRAGASRWACRAARCGRGPGGRAPGPARQVPDLGARRRGVPAGAPADDRELLLSIRRRAAATGACGSRCPAGTSWRSATRAASAPASSCSGARRAGRVLRHARGARAARAGAHGRGAAGAGARPARADQGLPARPAPRRGRREHLRRRGALPRARCTRCAPRARSSGSSTRRSRTPSATSCAAGIDAGGASIDDFRHPDGVQGAFQDGFQVHLRRGEPCLRCGTEIVKFVAAGRGTYCVRKLPAAPSRSPRRPIGCRAMDQHEQQDTQYEAPVVEDVDVAEGPSSVAAGVSSDAAQVGADMCQTGPHGVRGPGVGGPPVEEGPAERPGRRPAAADAVLRTLVAAATARTGPARRAPGAVACARRRAARLAGGREARADARLQPALRLLLHRLAAPHAGAHAGAVRRASGWRSSTRRSRSARSRPWSPAASRCCAAT